MSIQGANQSDERFIISGLKKKAILQRKDDFHANSGKGDLKVHLVTRNGQGWIQAKSTTDSHTHFNIGLFYNAADPVANGVAPAPTLVPPDYNSQVL